MRGINFSEVEVTKEQFYKFINIYPNKLETNGFMGYLSFYDKKIYNSKDSESFLENNIICRIYTDYGAENYYIMRDVYEKYKEQIEYV